MKENTAQTIDPAETCECNPEWSSASGGGDWDDCRCSVPVTQKPEKVQNKKQP